MADELGKLEPAQVGGLSDAESAVAKRSLLEPGPPVRDDSIGRAANRYVSFQVVTGAVGMFRISVKTRILTAAWWTEELDLLQHERDQRSRSYD